MLKLFKLKARRLKFTWVLAARPPVARWTAQSQSVYVAPRCGTDLREAAGLGADVGLHSAPGIIPAEALAIECWRRLFQSGDYTLVQLSVFAEEIAQGGKRRFLVDTFASFANVGARPRLRGVAGW